MAGNPNSAYMMWRQFTGGARPTGGSQLSGYRAATIQQDRQIGQSQAEALSGFISSMADFGGQFATFKKAEKEQKDQQAERWLQQRTIQEARSELQFKNTGFEDDPIAMAALKNRMAFNISTQVDSDVESKIRLGHFRSQEELDAFRTEALNNARTDFKLEAGIADDDEAFNTGWIASEDKRRTSLAGLQSDVTNKYLATQSAVVKRASYTAWLTPQTLAGLKPVEVASTLSKGIERDKLQGLTRTPMEELEDIGNVLDHMKNVNGSTEHMRELGRMMIDVGNGNKVSVRDAMGGPKFDLMVVEALNNQQKNDATFYTKQAIEMSDMVANMDITGIDLRLDAAKIRSKGITSDEVTKWSNARALAVQKAEVFKRTQEEELAKATEKAGRLQGAVQALAGADNGTSFLVSPTAAGLGLKDEEEATEAEAMFLNGISDPEKRGVTAMRLSVLRPTGYSAKALQSAASRANADWNDYLTRLKSGQEAEVPSSVKNMQTLYQTNPAMFNGAVNPAQRQYASQFAIASLLNRDLDSIARSQIAFSKLPKAEQDDLKKKADIRLSNQRYLQDGYEGEALRVLTGDFLQTGIGPASAYEKAKEAFDQQHERINGSPIHKSILQVDPNYPASVEWGLSVLKSTMEERSKKTGVPVSQMQLAYQADKRTVTIMNPKTGAVLARAGQSDIRNAWAKGAQKREEQQKGYLRSLMLEQNRRNETAKKLEKSSFGETPFLFR